MRLGVFPPVVQWVQQLWIQTGEASQLAGIKLVGFALGAVDEPRLARISYQHLMSTLLEQSANPGRVSPCLNSDAQRLLGVEAASEGLRGSAQPTLLDHLTALCVDEAQVAVLVAQIQAGCHVWWLPDSIHCGSILLPIGSLKREPV